MGFKWIFVLSLALLQAAYYRRMKWSIFKSRKLIVDAVNWSTSSFTLHDLSKPWEKKAVIVMPFLDVYSVDD